MQDLNEILSNLTPEKRVLLEKKIQSNPQAYNVFPLSFAQRRLWFLNQLEPSSTAYNIPFAVEISGSLKFDVLEKSINKIVERHEILRTTILSLNETPMQIVNKHGEVKIELIDISKKNSNESKFELDEKIRTLNNIIFNLNKGPLFNCTLFKLSNDKFVLHVVMHHIISDGWSVGIFINEFIESYSSFSKSQEPKLSELKIQYADFAKWQSIWINSEDYKKQLSYWDTEFSELPEPLNLPIDFLRPKIKKYNGATKFYELKPFELEKVNHITKQAGCSVFMFFLAVLNILLFKYSNGKDISIGTPIANRQRHEIQGLLGFFVNTLVLRSHINSKKTFYEFLDDVKKKVLDSFENQEIPFETLVERLHPVRNMGISPLFQVMFSYQKNSNSLFKVDDLSFIPYKIENDKSKFDLSFSISEYASNSFILSIEYDTDLLTENTVDRFADSFKVLLNQISSDPAKTINQLSPLIKNDIKIIEGLNSTEYEYPKTENIVELFERNLHDYYEHDAVVYEGKSISFAELNSKSNKLANYLKRKGVSQDSIVGILFERSIESIITIFSIWKAGAAYLPLIPSYPKDRIEQILNDSQPKFLLSDSKSISLVGDINLNTLLIDELWYEINLESSSNLNSLIYPSNLAYVIYTSGSTGRPKGVMIQHESLVNLAYGLKKIIFNDNGIDNLKVSLNAPLLFDASLQQIIQLCFGHTLYIIPDETRLDSEKLLDFIRDQKLDVFDCVPTQLKFLIEYGLLDENHWIPSRILPGGEAIDELTWQRISKCEKADFYNMYGPTECTVDPTICVVKENSLKPSIGKPIINVHTYVLNDDLQLVPPGVTGELYITGNCLSRGYFKNADLTAQRFIPEPFTNIPGQRMYSTGDKVRLGEDGNLEYLERIDDQVKLRGFRIELGEIDFLLTQFEEIKQSITIFNKDSKNSSRIVSYCIVNEGYDISSKYISGKIAEKLPDYMVPSLIIILDKFPLLPNGKVDKNELKKLNYEDFREAEIESPTTETEKKVAKIFSDVLELDYEISIKDNFFDLGGHSLLATKCISRIRDSFRIDLPLKTIFNNPDIAGLSNIIDQFLPQESSYQRFEIQKISHDHLLPLSFAQQRLWFLSELEPNNNVYNIPSAVRIKGAFKLNLFQKSVDRLVERHEILRTSFQLNNGIPYQKIHEPFNVDLNVIDLSNEKKDEMEKRLAYICLGEYSKEFYLNKLPLFSITPIILEPDEFIIFTNIHHIISDGWSSGIIVKEIVKFYMSYLNKIEPKIKELPIQYADYSKWQRDWLNGDEYERHADFWRNYLQFSQSTLKLPLDKDRPDVQTNNGDIFSRKLIALDNIKINEILKESGSTHFMFFLSIFNLLIYRLTNQEDLIVGVPIVNRDLPEIQDLIGLFVNTIVIRADLSQNISFNKLLSQIKESSLKAFEHKEFPFEKILDAVKIDRHTGYSPLFQIMFTFNHYEEPDNSISDIKFNEFEFKANTSKFDLSITVQETAEKNYICGFEYNTDLFTDNTIEKWLNYYNDLINEVVSDPDKPILKYSLEDYSSTLAALSLPDEYINITERISENAVKNAGKLALISDEQKITYSELDSLVDNLSEELFGKGVNAGDFVGLYLDRSPEAIILMLAVIRIGAAFVPLDIKSPSKRIIDIIGDSKIKCIVTTSQYSKELNEEIKLIILDSLNDFNQTKSIQITKWNNAYAVLPAYVIYTSGTSGKPKGVLVSNGNISGFIQAAVNDYVISTDDRILQFASLSFDTSLEEIFPILFQGGTLVLRNDEMVGSKESFLEMIESHRITVLDLPTAFWQNIVNEIISAKLNFPKCLKKIIIGGEKANRDLVKKWLEYFGNEIELLNTYGPTETTVVASYWIAKDISEGYYNEVPIGKPISNSTLYVLDKNLNETPENIVGVLYIGGAGVSYGYLNDPYKTATSFIPDPFSQIPDRRLYNTGDLVRKLPTGEIEFIGRVDNQIKIRGFRVEIDEIEIVINRLPEIMEAIAVVNISTKKERLVCFYKSKNEIRYDDFVYKIKGTLPEYMIPSAFIKLDEIPLTTSGKVDRKNLAIREFAVSSEPKSIIKPETEKEKILFDIWKIVLGIENFGVTDNFFELGGDSIIGIQIISEGRKEGLLIKPIHLFQYQTIKDLAVVAEFADSIEAEQGLVIGDSDLTPIQKTFFEMNFHNPNHWNQSLLLKVDDLLDIDILKRTAVRLLEHHDSLRIKIAYDQNLNEFRQIFSENINQNAFEYYEINGLDDQKTKIEEICSDVQRSLDLEKGEIIKIAYIRINNKEGRILFIVHHIAVDGVSWRILIEDFQSIYTQLLNKSDVIIPAKTTSFKDWSKNLNTYLNSENIKDELEYWLNISKEINNHLPVDYNNSINDERSSKNIEIELSVEETEHLTKDVHSKYNTKINDILLTALVRSYSVWTGKRSLTINMENHGRDLPIDGVDVSRTVGWFTSIYPCHLDLRKTVDPGDTIKNIKEQLRLIPNNGNTYGLMRFLLNDIDKVSRLKIFDDIGVTFNYLGQIDNLSKGESVFSIATENKGNERDENNLRESLIDITGIISGGKMRLSFNFSKNIFNEISITEWANLYIKELKNLISHCLSVTEKSFTSSDFNLSNLNDKKLEKVLNKVKKKK